MPVINPKVIDLSHHNVVDDLTKVKSAGILGIIHKATQGIKIIDREYENRRAMAQDAKLLWGAYHFGVSGNPIAQAKFFLSVAKPASDTLVALDWEPYKNTSMSRAEAITFLKEIEQTLGRKAVLYSGVTAKEQLAQKNDSFFGSHRLWLCQYGSKPVIQRSWKTYWLWQFTGDGVGPEPHSIPGIKTQGIDINSFNGTDIELIQQWAS